MVNIRQVLRSNDLHTFLKHQFSEEISFLKKNVLQKYFATGFAFAKGGSDRCSTNISSVELDQLTSDFRVGYGRLVARIIEHVLFCA